MIWCTRADESPAAAASVQIETPPRGPRPVPSCVPAPLVQAPRRLRHPPQYPPFLPPGGHPVRGSHADTLPLLAMSSKLDGTPNPTGASGTSAAGEPALLLDYPPGTEGTLRHEADNYPSVTLPLVTWTRAEGRIW